MGVLNVTPDSFSDGGKFLKPAAAIDRGLQLIAAGADILDLGAESSRPGSRGVPAREQIKRLLPVVKTLRKQSQVTISIDTQSSAVAEVFLNAGADIINDISALRHDRRMLKVLRPWQCQVILMHMLGTPRTMQVNPVYKNVTAEILNFFRERVATCARSGIERSRLLLDPGIGFGKTLAHNLEILRKLRLLGSLKLPLVIGVSRKSFLGKISGEADPQRRLAGSLAAGLWSLQQGARILRVHDVAEHVAALKVWQAIRSGK